MLELEPDSPRTCRRPTHRTVGGLDLHDDYAWLRDGDDPEVLAHLAAENRHTEQQMASTAELQETLYREILGRLKETDLSVPFRFQGHLYYTRTEQGKQYPIHCRRRDATAAAEEVLLDLNALAAGRDYLALGSFEVSPDGRWLAFTLDETGDERYTLQVKDLTSGALRADRLTELAPSFAWAADSQHLLVARLDPANRPDTVLRHRLGDPAEAAARVWHEPDEAFFVEVAPTKDRRYLLLSASSSTTSEVWYLPSESPLATPKVLIPRRPAVEYSVEHHHGHFYVLTNEEAPDNRLLRAPVASFERGAQGVVWEEILPARPGTRLEKLEMLERFLVLLVRREGLLELHVRAHASGEEHVVAQPETLGTIAFGQNLEMASDTLRYHYSSLVTPPSVYDYRLDTRQATLLKRTEVLGGYEPSRFETHRIWARARDGERIPISLVHRRGLRLDGSSPCLLVGYGAYGVCSEPYFLSQRLALLDRGVVYAIAHVRGGGELGKRWHDAGKLAHKPNTFRDFLAAAEHLIASGYTRAERLAISGGSAGGLLIGAVLNERPELFAAALAAVPFVDVVNTMLDPSLPLTVTEYEEWGNPTEPGVLARLQSYSPYENVRAQEYPQLLVTAGLHDRRVGFWEPAKWVARLRATRRGSHRLLLRVQMDAGHGGASGRYEALRRTAFEYAFLLDALGLGAERPEPSAR
jgi:oligopeptidase B